MPKVKNKGKILKAGREKQLVTFRGVLISLSADFSKQTLKARRDRQEIFKVMKSRDLQPRLLYLAKLSFRIKGQIKSFLDKKKLKEFIITNRYYRKCQRDLFKKKKIKTMNNEMPKNTNLSTIESKKQTKQRRIIMDTESILKGARLQGDVEESVKR